MFVVRYAGDISYPPLEEWCEICRYRGTVECCKLFFWFMSTVYLESSADSFVKH